MELQQLIDSLKTELETELNEIREKLDQEIQNSDQAVQELIDETVKTLSDIYDPERIQKLVLDGLKDNVKKKRMQLKNFSFGSDIIRETTRSISGSSSLPQLQSDTVLDVLKNTIQTIEAETETIPDPLEYNPSTDDDLILGEYTQDATPVKKPVTKTMPTASALEKLRKMRKS